MARARWLEARLTRRQFLHAAAAATSAVLFARAARLARAGLAPDPLGFLTDDELRLVDAFTARLVPTGTSVGAHEAGVADYIQGLLSAFPGADANADGRVGAADLTAVVQALGGDDAAADANGDGRVDAADLPVTESSIFDGALAGPPAFAGRPIYAGGPFSGRTPFGDPATGTPSDDFPDNAFRTPLPLGRLQRIAWTVRLLGADAVPELAANPLARTLPDTNLRQRYRLGLAGIDQLSMTQFALPFVELSAEQQDTIVAAIRRDFRVFYDLLVDHTVEGLLCAPEYGGNRDGVGWELVGFDGDSQPLGYTIFDEMIQDYRERPDKPNSTIDPDDPCTGFTPEMLAFLRVLLVQLAQAEEFDAPFCFPGT
jgi:gluconate 2-dehydrogenase gamma chain